MLDSLSAEARLATLIVLVWLIIGVCATVLIGTAPRTGGRGDPRAGRAAAAAHGAASKKKN
jgi:hypothetical protein